MKRILALSLAAAGIVAPLAAATPASAQEPRTVTKAEKQRLIAEAQAENQRLAEREKEFYASQERLQAQMADARAKNDSARYNQLLTLKERNEAQRERQRAANADRQRRIQAIYALRTSD